MTRYYFVYGSNMDREDLDSWSKNEGKPKIEFSSVLPVKLNDYKLSFNYHSISREAGAANIMRSDNDCVYGILTELDEPSINTLREKEGYPDKYDEIKVEVMRFDGTKVQEVTTFKVKTEREKEEYQAPTRYYLGLIIKNAEKYRFPEEYIEFLKSFKTTD